MGFCLSLQDGSSFYKITMISVEIQFIQGLQIYNGYLTKYINKWLLMPNNTLKQFITAIKSVTYSLVNSWYSQSNDVIFIILFTLLKNLIRLTKASDQCISGLVIKKFSIGMTVQGLWKAQLTLLTLYT